MRGPRPNRENCPGETGWAAHSANAGLAFGKAPGPRQVYTLSGYAARDPVTVAGELHAICGRSEGMSVRGRTMARGTEAFRKEETCAVGCTDRGWIPGGDLTAAEEPAAPGRAAGRSGGAVPAPGGGSSQGPGMDHGVPLPRPPQGRQALQLAGAWRLAATCGQRLHSGGEREPEPGQGNADSPPDIPFC